MAQTPDIKNKPALGLSRAVTPSLGSTSTPPNNALKFGIPTCIKPNRTLLPSVLQPEKSPFNSTTTHMVSFSNPTPVLPLNATAQGTSPGARVSSHIHPKSTPATTLTPDTAITKSVPPTTSTVETSASGFPRPSKTPGDLVQQSLTAPRNFGFVPSSSFAAATKLSRAMDPITSSGVPNPGSHSSSTSNASIPERFGQVINLTPAGVVGGSANVFGNPAAPTTFVGGRLSGAAKTKMEIQPAAPASKISRPKLFKSGDEFITFLIGKQGGEKKFLIHKSFACHYSPVLRRVLGFSKESPLLHHIEDTSEEAFSLLSQWMYEQALDDTWDSDVTDQQAAHLIAELYTLAEKMQIPQLQNLAIEYFEEVLTRPVDLTFDLVSYCWENTKAGSPLRRLLVDLHTWDIKMDRLVGRVKQMPKEMLEDIVLSLKDRCENKPNSFSMHARNIADFQINDVDE